MNHLAVPILTWGSFFFARIFELHQLHELLWITRITRITRIGCIIKISFAIRCFHCYRFRDEWKRKNVFLGKMVDGKLNQV
jgi:hypothetical protein